MDLEFHQLDLRYEALRSRSPAREQRLLASLAAVGQTTPIVVVTATAAAEASGHVVIDGYKRVRLLRTLRRDTVTATAWDLGEVEALVLERAMRAGEADSALEQGWLLRELRDRFHLGGAALAERVGRTESWVSRRLALVAELPEPVQAYVRAGAIGAHAAMKCLVPLARANPADAARLADVVAPLSPSSRQMAVLYAAWTSASRAGRELLLKDPALVLRSHEETRRTRARKGTGAEQLIGELGAIGALAGKAYQRARRGAIGDAIAVERDEIKQTLEQTRREVARLLQHLDKELDDARREHPAGDPAAA
jgi:ParB family transcriptional regulator, chromosome partitioning protein